MTRIAYVLLSALIVVELLLGAYNYAAALAVGLLVGHLVGTAVNRRADRRDACEHAAFEAKIAAMTAEHNAKMKAIRDDRRLTRARPRAPSTSAGRRAVRA